EVVIEVRSGKSGDLVRLVVGGEAAIGLACCLHDPRVEALALLDEGVLLVRPAAQRPKMPRRVHLAEVASLPLIFFDRGSSDWTLTQGLFRRAGLVPNVAMEVDTIEAAKRMVERGLGMGFLPHMAVARELRRKVLVALEVMDGEPLRRSLDVLH